MLIASVHQRVAGLGVLQTNQRADVASSGFVNFGRAQTNQLDHACCAFGTIGTGGNHGITFTDGALIHTHERHVAQIRHAHDFEHHGAQWRFRIANRWNRRGFEHVAHLELFDRVTVSWIRQDVDHGVEQHLDAFVSQRGAAQHRLQLERHRASAQTLHDLFVVQRAGVEVRGFDFFIAAMAGDGIDHGVTALLRFRQELSRNVVLFLVFALFTFKGDVFHRHQIDDRAEFVARTDWHLNRNWVTGQTFFHLTDHAIKVGAQAVHLVDEHQARNRVLVGLTPHGFGLRLHAGHGAEHHHGAVEHAARTFDFSGEVHVSRGVDQIDIKTTPLREHRSCGDGDAAFLLFLHPVGRRRAIVYFTDFMLFTGVIEDAFRNGGLARIDVGNDTEIARLDEVDGHDDSKQG